MDCIEWVCLLFLLAGKTTGQLFCFAAGLVFTLALRSQKLFPQRTGPEFLSLSDRSGDLS